MSCVNEKLTLMPKGFYPEPSCAGPTPYCPPGLSKHYRCGRTCGGSDWRVDPPLYYASKSAALEDGACYLSEDGVAAPADVRVPAARTVPRPQPDCATVHAQQQQQWLAHHPCSAAANVAAANERYFNQQQQQQQQQQERAGCETARCATVQYGNGGNYNNDDQMTQPAVPLSATNNDASGRRATVTATAPPTTAAATPMQGEHGQQSEVMDDRRPSAATAAAAYPLLEAVAQSRLGQQLRTVAAQTVRGINGGGGHGGVYPYVPPPHTQPPCPTTSAAGPPQPALTRPRDELPCGARYTHDGYRASCGRYNYGAGNARGLCGGYAGRWGEAAYGCEVARTGCGGTCPPNEFTFDGWTEVGEVFNHDAYPITDYLTKSCTRCDCDPFLRCQFGECTGCRAQASPLDRGDDGAGGCAAGDYWPQPSSMSLENKGVHQRRASAFERPTMFTNNGIGYGPFGNAIGGPRCGARKNTQLGFAYGTLHATGCKCNRCSQDVMLHPRTTVTTPAVSRKYRLFARRAVDCVSAELSSSRLEFAVAAAGVVDPMLIVLPRNPRQPPGACYYASGCGAGYEERAWVELKSGDQIYVPGERGPFAVHMYADDAGPYRHNNAVFRGWGPQRRQPDMVRKHLSNSGLRNFSGTPSANALLRPF